MSSKIYNEELTTPLQAGCVNEVELNLPHVRQVLGAEAGPPRDARQPGVQGSPQGAKEDKGERLVIDGQCCDCIEGKFYQHLSKLNLKKGVLRDNSAAKPCQCLHIGGK